MIPKNGRFPAEMGGLESLRKLLHFTTTQHITIYDKVLSQFTTVITINNDLLPISTKICENSAAIRDSTIKVNTQFSLSLGEKKPKYPIFGLASLAYVLMAPAVERNPLKLNWVEQLRLRHRQRKLYVEPIFTTYTLVYINV